jgi:leader peptidase (prepilin peptidase)/N-methyltransferase
MHSIHDFISQHLWEVAAAMGVLGALVGYLLRLWSTRLCRRFRDLDSNTQPVSFGRLPWIEGLTASLFAGYFVAVFGLHVLDCHEVRPDLFWFYGRTLGHLVLIALLIAATATDLQDFIIPDEFTTPGMLLGVLLATASGDTQIMHLWVDWNHPLVEVYGQWIPDWIRDHPHWHGLAWSTAGLITGGGMTWLCRIVSSVALKQESLGFGDVTLMAMIGSFLGWQPMVFVFLLAPLCAILIGMAVRTLTNRPFVPYGPYLSLAAVIVLLTWKWLWQLEIPGVLSIRRLFGDAIGLGILAGVAIVAFIILLGVVRLYRLIPGKQPE